MPRNPPDYTDPSRLKAIAANLEREYFYILSRYPGLSTEEAQRQAFLKVGQRLPLGESEAQAVLQTAWANHRQHKNQEIEAAASARSARSGRSPRGATSGASKPAKNSGPARQAQPIPSPQPDRPGTPSPPVEPAGAVPPSPSGELRSVRLPQEAFPNPYDPDPLANVPAHRGGKAADKTVVTTRPSKAAPKPNPRGDVPGDRLSLTYDQMLSNLHSLTSLSLGNNKALQDLGREDLT